MPQGWLRRERAQALDLFDLGGRLGIDAELVGRVVVEQVVHVLEESPRDRPAHLVAQVGDELIESLDLRKHRAVVGRHRLSPRSVPSST